jgi:hypothetical protein
MMEHHLHLTLTLLDRIVLPHDPHLLHTGGTGIDLGTVQGMVVTLITVSVVAYRDPLGGSG